MVEREGKDLEYFLFVFVLHPGSANNYFRDKGDEGGPIESTHNALLARQGV